MSGFIFGGPKHPYFKLFLPIIRFILALVINYGSKFCEIFIFLENNQKLYEKI